jgi:hypothetical protein
LLTRTEDNFPPSSQCPDPLSLAGFQVITAGRFWVFTEGRASGSQSVLCPRLFGDDRRQHGRHGFDMVSGSCGFCQRARKRKGHRDCEGFRPEPSRTHRQLRKLRRGRLSFRIQFRTDDAGRPGTTGRHNSCSAPIGAPMELFSHPPNSLKRDGEFIEPMLLLRSGDLPDGPEWLKELFLRT